MQDIQARVGHIVAILRGVQPHEVVAIGQALVDAGIRTIEVPLNSPDPYASITALEEAFGITALIGAGTVLEPGQVDKVKAAGGKLIVSPNTNTDVICRTKEHGLVSMPGFATASEAFAALDAGADALKMFPAGPQGAGALSALKSVMPAGTAIYAVGGVGPANMQAFARAGADGFGLGSNLYRPGDSADDIEKKAKEAVTACAAAYQ